jgi:protein-disulfide isomerase
VNWFSLRSWLGTVVRLGLGGIWLWAGIEKVSQPRQFVQAVRAYDATPEWLSKAIGYGLPILEICLGILLVVGIAVRLAAAASAVLFVVFLAGFVEVAARGIKLECGCFGGGGPTAGATSYTLDILRDIGLLVLAAFLVVWSFTRLSIEEYLARHDYVEPPSAKRMRSPEGQRKYQALVEQRRQRAIHRALYVNSSLTIVVVLVTFIGIGVQANNAKVTGSTTATNASVSSGVLWGKKAAATVDLFEDFQCPHCLEFEQQVGATLQADTRANKAQLLFHPLSFLDANSANQYSSRAANAALCVSDISADAFVKYHSLLFTPAVQPKEGTKGPDNTQLIVYAGQIGLTKDQVNTVTTCIQTKQHAALVQAITENASKRGVNGTPTVWVNGKSVAATVDAVTKAIAAADAKGPAPSPSKTPTPTPSVSTTPSGTTTTTPKTTPTSSASA